MDLYSAVDDVGHLIERGHAPRHLGGTAAPEGSRE